MNLKASRFTFLVIAALALVAGLVISERRTGKARAFTDVVRSEDFQAGQRYRRSGEGCIALTAMDDVDVLVVGSSQAYAGIDAVVLAERFAPQTTAVCALPAWTVGHFDLLMQFLEAERLTPRRVIWVADPMAVMETAITDARLERARGVFLSEDTRAGVRGQWARMMERTGAPLPVDAEERRTALAEQRAGIASLDIADMEAVLASREMTSFSTLGGLLETARPYPGREARLARFCAALRQRGVVLDVVAGPVPRQTSAYISSLGNRSVPDSIEAFGRDLEAWLPCARRVLARSAEGWGLDLRHYTNRMAAPDYPYEVWDSPQAFDAHASTLDRRGRVELFDSSHLNLAGAVLFTGAMVDALN